MNIVIYGLGSRYKKYADMINSESIVGVCDKNIKNKNMTSYHFVLPEDLSSIEYDFIVVTSKRYYLEISSELVLKYHVDWSRIIDLSYYNYVTLKKEIAKDWITSISKVLNNGKTAKRLIELPKGCELNDNLSLHPSRRDVFNCNGVWLNVSKVRRTYCNYVVSHRPYQELNTSDYKTIWVGDIREKREQDLSDNSGDNISKYNSLFNECTALYWIWKNQSDDIVGLSHYRRFLSSVVNPGIPIMKWEACQILKNVDVMVAAAVYHDGYTNYEQLIMTTEQDCVDSSINELRTAISINGTDDLEYLELFLNARAMYPCNMFIMRRDLLDEYCAWLFPILFYMIKHVEIKKEWSSYSKRILGFWAERLFNVWLLKTNYTIKELPIIQTDFSDSYRK